MKGELPMDTLFNKKTQDKEKEFDKELKKYYERK